MLRAVKLPRSTSKKKPSISSSSVVSKYTSDAVVSPRDTTMPVSKPVDVSGARPGLPMKVSGVNPKRSVNVGFFTPRPMFANKRGFSPNVVPSR